jgi:Ca2+-binding RTX toxin-like protein
MTIISSDRETAFDFSSDHQQLIIKPGVVLAPTSSFYAISDDPSGPSNAFHDWTVANYGGIFAIQTGIQSYGSNATILNYASGSIVGFEAVYLGGQSPYVANMGYMHGNADALFVDASGLVLANSGTISADVTAIDVSSQMSFRLDNSGLIDGGTLSIGMEGPGAGYAKIFNTGRMVGAVLLQDASFCVVHNSGQIEGAVAFQGSNDRFDGRGGVVTGQVSGGAGADTLWGGAADDTLYGGTGLDRLKGGAGADSFVYAGVGESRGVAVDVIGDWDATDVLDLSQIDVNNAKAGIQHLTFGGLIGAADPVAEDKVQYYKQAGGTYVVADVNGDGHADFMVRIVGLFNLDANDFVLG